MRKVINIDIPKPCSENWNNMTPNEKGRHCAACKKTVFDFTTKTDEQIIKTFEQNNNLCGRFKATQLQRDIVLSRKEKNNYVTYLASGFFAFMGLASPYIHAQGETKVVQTDSTKQNHIVGKIKPKPLVNENLISGIITDEDNTPLPGVNVLVKGTSDGIATDFDGKFSLKANKGDVLVMSYIGFKTKELKITEKENNIILVMDEAILDGMVVVGYGVVDESETKYVCSPEELERKKQNKFRRTNASEFYKKQYKAHRQKIRNGDIERSSFGKFFYKMASIFR
ncbi:carboxypeptidase-like regulatory domain-containing protein [Mariniflexile gromovii]|uniref:Carboxypeptidase-like regulatory domain-containing protein n=1 Tax=Mariniflexile gromovii TaxID=362523 RepID=A0ABS4BNT4_9FLAO|nr:carboxypeptidase-like regulatory domain-containing protein [Mariniflexile gromovii]MBP0902256.1 carboxypeptidase-like regulatory domain-containing protein [Mariniflexile gromovii]